MQDDEKKRKIDVEKLLRLKGSKSASTAKVGEPPSGNDGNNGSDGNNDGNNV